MTDKMREAFERSYCHAPDKDENGHYVDDLWEDRYIDFAVGYQAALASPEVQKLVELVRDYRAEILGRLEFAKITREALRGKYTDGAMMRDAQDAQRIENAEKALQPFTKG